MRILICLKKYQDTSIKSQDKEIFFSFSCELGKARLGTRTGEKEVLCAHSVIFSVTEFVIALSIKMILSHVTLFLICHPIVFSNQPSFNHRLILIITDAVGKSLFLL
jgi:hypothetical protein